MNIRQATYADKERWDAYVLSHRDGSAYQLFAWKEAVEEAYSFTGLYLLAENDRELCGVLPLIDFRVPLVGKAFISLPYCDAGGVLADNHDTESSLLEAACLMAEEVSARVKLRSAKPLSDCGHNRTDKVSMLLDLPDNSESLLSDFKSKFRLKIKKPIRDGLKSVLGGDELLNDFYLVFAENMRDIGSPVHSLLWLQSIVASYGEKVRVGVIYTPDNIPVAAGIIVLHPNRVSNPWASSLRRYNYMRPNMLLYWTFLSFASDNGYKQFDFGRSTLNEGTYEFKRQWGAISHPLYWYEIEASRKDNDRQESADGQIFGQIPDKRQLAANLWKKLPQAGADWFGPRIRKYISL